jgi:carbon-monoxide dehydrogenase medium subunit
MYDFTYQRPQSVADAANALKNAEDGKFLSGGQTLLPTMKQRLAMPSDLIDLTSIPELKGITVNSDSLVIGAAETHASVAASADVAKVLPALADLAGQIGDPHVRHRGTLGGSVANNDPNADYPAAVLALGATVHTSQRKIAADDFFVDVFETALEPDEIITAIEFPLPRKAGYAKFAHPASRYALVGVFVARFDTGVRLAVTGAGPGVFRVDEMEAALGQNFSPEALADIKIDADGLNADLQGSAEYRAHLITVMAKRAVVNAA